MTGAELEDDEADGCAVEIAPLPAEWLPYVVLFASLLDWTGHVRERDADALRARAAEWRALFGGR